MVSRDHPVRSGAFIVLAPAAEVNQADSGQRLLDNTSILADLGIICGRLGVEIPENAISLRYVERGGSRKDAFA